MMATRATILNSTLTAIANAIRSKTGKTAAILPSAMPDEILGISTGVDTSDATLVSGASMLSGVTAYGKAGTKITGTIPSKAAATYTPGTVNQTIAAGRYLSGAQTIKGDANLVAANIKSGVSIFGVTGTLAPTILEITEATFVTTGSSATITIDLSSKVSEIKTIYGLGCMLVWKCYDSYMNSTICLSATGGSIKVDGLSFAYTINGAVLSFGTGLNITSIVEIQGFITLY